MRMMPPADGLRPAINVNGRSYTCALGSTIDVPDQDGAIMAANGWTQAAVGQSGTTAARPSAPAKGDEYHDTNLGYVVKFDGKVWRNPHTGAAV
jgi:hypothetical protein